MSDELPDILGEDLGYLLGWVALGATKDDGCEAARAIGAEIDPETHAFALERLGKGTQRDLFG